MAKSNGNRSRGFWKLNDNLLFDEACVVEIKEAIMNFIKRSYKGHYLLTYSVGGFEMCSAGSIYKTRI